MTNLNGGERGSLGAVAVAVIVAGAGGEHEVAVFFQRDGLFGGEGAVNLGAAHEPAKGQIIGDEIVIDDTCGVSHGSALDEGLSAIEGTPVDGCLVAGIRAEERDRVVVAVIAIISAALHEVAIGTEFSAVVDKE